MNISSFYKNFDDIKRIHIVATCIWMAAKITEFEYLKLSIYVSKLSSIVNNMEEKIILESETEIVSHLSGILYIAKLYKKCNSVHHLRLTFDNIIMSKDSTLYGRVDIDKWVDVMNEQNKLPGSKNLSIKKFLED